MSALSALGTTQSFTGQWEPGLSALTECIGFYDVESHTHLKFDCSEDPCVQAYLIGALCAWHLGDDHRSLEYMNEGLRLAKHVEHANSIGYSLSFNCILHYLRADPNAAKAAVGMAHAWLKGQDLPIWTAAAQVVGGWAETLLEPGVDRRPAIRGAINDWRGTGSAAIAPLHIGVLASASLRLGRFEEALEEAEEGLALALGNGEHGWEAELHRLKGRAHLGRNRPDIELGERSLRTALQVSRDQKAVAIELRVAVDLATHCRQMRRHDEAVAILGSACGLFEAETETMELLAARSLLGSWARQ